MGELECLNDPESYAGGREISWQGHPCQTGRRLEARQSTTTGPPGWGWAAGQSPATVKLLWITETLDTTNNELRRRTVDIPDDPEIAVVENMTLEDQSRKDVHKSITIPAVSFTTPKGHDQYWVLECKNAIYNRKSSSGC